MFSDYINFRDPSIPFTMEREIDKKISFPDRLSDKSTVIHLSLPVYITRRRLLVFLLIILVSPF